MSKELKTIEQNKKIDSFIKDMFDDSRVNGFYPTTISRELGIPLTNVLKRMHHISGDESGVIKSRYEIRCENQHILSIVDDYSDYLDDCMYCMQCDEDIYVTKNNITLKYIINDEHRNL